MNPDCRDGKHQACSGDGWDMEYDQDAPCTCRCHDLQPDLCDGSDQCGAPWHVHGCYADAGACDRPEQHTIAAESPRQRLIGELRNA